MRYIPRLRGTVRGTRLATVQGSPGPYSESGSPVPPPSGDGYMAITEYWYVAGASPASRYEVVRMTVGLLTHTLPSRTMQYPIAPGRASQVSRAASPSIAAVSPVIGWSAIVVALTSLAPAMASGYKARTLKAYMEAGY